MEIKTVIATCSPYSNFEEVTSFLQQAGLAQGSDIFLQWHDALFQAAGVVEPFGAEDRLLLELKTKTSSDIVLPLGGGAPLLMADRRCLWLLDFWAEKLPEAKFLLFFISAESALVHACRNRLEPQEVLEYWQAASFQLLNFKRRHRKNALLLDMEAAIRSPQNLQDVCKGIGLALQPPATPIVPERDLATLEYYLAKILLERNPELLALQTELKASAHPIEEEPSPDMKPLVLFRQQSQRLADQNKLEKNYDITARTLKNAERRIRELTEEKLKQKKQIDQLISNIDKQEKLRIESQSKIKTFQQLNDEMKKAADESNQENELLLLQLHQVQEELERIFIEKQKDQIENQAVKARLEQLTKDLEMLKRKNSDTQTKVEEKKKLNNEGETIAKEALEEDGAQLQKVAQMQQFHRKNRSAIALRKNSPLNAIAKLFKRFDKDEKEIQKQIKLLNNSGLFDASWYSASNLDVVAAGCDPVEHYIRYGAVEGRDPSPIFSTKGYLKINLDVAETGMNPLVHYIQYGKTEGRGTGKVK